MVCGLLCPVHYGDGGPCAYPASTSASTGSRCPSSGQCSLCGRGTQLYAALNVKHPHLNGGSGGAALWDLPLTAAGCPERSLYNELAGSSLLFSTYRHVALPLRTELLPVLSEPALPSQGQMSRPAADGHCARPLPGSGLSPSRRPCSPRPWLCRQIGRYPRFRKPLSPGLRLNKPNPPQHMVSDV